MMITACLNLFASQNWARFQLAGLGAALIFLMLSGCSQPKGATTEEELGAMTYEALKAKNTMAMDDLMLNEEAAAQALQHAKMPEADRTAAESELKSDVARIRSELQGEFVAIQAFAKEAKLDWSASALKRVKHDSGADPDGMEFTSLEIIIGSKGRSYSIFAEGIKAAGRWYLLRGLKIIPIDA